MCDSRRKLPTVGHLGGSHGARVFSPPRCPTESEVQIHHGGEEKSTQTLELTLIRIKNKRVIGNNGFSTVELELTGTDKYATIGPLQKDY